MSPRFRLVATFIFLAASATIGKAQVLIGQNFEGTTSAIQPIPPDTMGAAGIDYFVELNNDEFNVFRKSDGMQVLSKGINQFWVDANTAPLMTPFDPRVVYDPHARRWYAASVDSRQSANNILFAISSSSDPTQPWHGFAIDSDSDNSNWADFPMIGYHGEGVFISAFMPTLGAAPPRSSFIVLPKFDLLQPAPSIANMTQFQDVPEATAGLRPQLAVDASNTFGTLMEVVDMSSFGGGAVLRSDITPPGAPVLGNAGFLFAPAAQPPNVVQPGAPAVQDLHSNDWRFSSNTVLHNGDLFAVQAIDDGGRAAIRFLRLDVVNHTVLESTVISDPARAYTFPSIAVNERGDIVIGATGTSTSEFASSYAFVRQAGAGVFDTRLLKAGVDNYERLDSQNRNRWGDYSATTVDPADPGIVWTNQEFVAATNRWATQVTELILQQPDEARWMDPTSGLFDDPLMWHTPHGAAPQATDQLIFSRATDPAGGTYTVTVPPLPVHTHASASFRQGNVFLDMNGQLLDLALHLEVGPYAGHPQVTVENGTVMSVAGFIASRPTAEGHLTLNNAQWHVASDLIIGSDAAIGSGGLLPGANGGTGSLTIDNNSELNVARLKLWQQGTVNLLDGVVTATFIENPHPLAFNFMGGVLHVDTFIGDLHQFGGTLAPGSSIGATDVLFGYFQNAGASLEIEIDGASLGMFDQLHVGGTADFNGLLDVQLGGGFMPSLGDTFQIVSAGFIPLTGYLNLLSQSTLPSLTNVLDFRLFYEPTALTLAAVPAVTGDYNADGIVNAADFTVWRNLFGATGIGLAADGNFDLVVDFVDLLLWNSNIGAIAPGSGSGAEVPEPSSFVLLAIGLLSVAACKLRSRIQ